MVHVIRTLSGKTTWKEDLWAPMIQPIACCAMATRQLKCRWLVGLNAGQHGGPCLQVCSRVPKGPALHVLLLLNDIPHKLSDCQLRLTNCCAEPAGSHWLKPGDTQSYFKPSPTQVLPQTPLGPQQASVQIVQGFGGFLFEGDEKHRPALEAIIGNRKEAGPEVSPGQWGVG